MPTWTLCWCKLIKHTNKVDTNYLPSDKKSHSRFNAYLYQCDHHMCAYDMHLRSWRSRLHRLRLCWQGENWISFWGHRGQWPHDRISNEILRHLQTIHEIRSKRSSVFSFHIVRWRKLFACMHMVINAGTVACAEITLAIMYSWNIGPGAYLNYF